MRIHSNPFGAKTIHTDPSPQASGGKGFVILTTLVCVLAVAVITLLRTNSIAEFWPARANLHRAILVTKPEGWQPRDDAARAFFDIWCKWPDTLPCPTESKAYVRAIEGPWFRGAFNASRGEILAGLQKPSLEAVDLVGADISNSFLPGVAFNGADLRNASFANSVLEGAHIENAILDGADFSAADLRATRLSAEHAGDVSFVGANLADASIFSTSGMTGDFRGASMKRTRFRGMITGNFSGLVNRPVRFQNANFTRVRIIDSYISGKNGINVFANANLLGLEFVNGANHLPDGASARFDGTALRWLDLRKIATLAKTPAPTQSEWRAWNSLLRNSFGDGSVHLPEGMVRPCQWLDGIEHSEQVFFGTWRAWLEKGNRPWPPVAGLDGTPTDAANASVARSSFAPSQAKSLPENIPEDCVWQK